MITIEVCAPFKVLRFYLHRINTTQRGVTRVVLLLCPRGGIHVCTR